MPNTACRGGVVRQLFGAVGNSRRKCENFFCGFSSLFSSESNLPQRSRVKLPRAPHKRTAAQYTNLVPSVGRPAGCSRGRYTLHAARPCPHASKFLHFCEFILRAEGRTFHTSTLCRPCFRQPRKATILAVKPPEEASYPYHSRDTWWYELKRIFTHRTLRWCASAGKKYGITPKTSPSRTTPHHAIAADSHRVGDLLRGTGVRHSGSLLPLPTRYLPLLRVG